MIGAAYDVEVEYAEIRGDVGQVIPSACFGCKLSDLRFGDAVSHLVRANLVIMRRNVCSAPVQRL